MSDRTRPTQPANLYRTIVDEVTRSGEPTDKCCRIYQQLQQRRGRPAMKRDEYWAAVREGKTRYRMRSRKDGGLVDG